MLRQGQFIDRFLVEAEIGRGGMGVVYRVRHVELDSLFALKLVAVNQPGLHARLVQEGRAQARIRHVNVVNVADVIKEPDLIGLVMEFVNGPTLDRWLGLRIPAVHEVEELYLGILSGVEHAHAAGVIHRDLKARNILLEITSTTIVPKVSDFGIARYSTGDSDPDMRLTLDNVPMGTPGYMAPEQVRNARDVDHRADIFALGVLLYRLLCGTTPFDAEDSFEVMDRTVRGDYVPPRRLRNDIPIRMERTILSCLQVDPARRPQSCAEIRDMLRIGANRTAMAPPPSAGFPVALETPVLGWPEGEPDADAVAELRAALAGEGSGGFRRPAIAESRGPRSPDSLAGRPAETSRTPRSLAPDLGRSRPDLRPLTGAAYESGLSDVALESAPPPRPRLPPTEPYPFEVPPHALATGGAEVLPADAVPSRLGGFSRVGAPVVTAIAFAAVIAAAFVALQEPPPTAPPTGTAPAAPGPTDPAPATPAETTATDPVPAATSPGSTPATTAPAATSRPGGASANPTATPPAPAAGTGATGGATTGATSGATTGATSATATKKTTPSTSKTSAASDPAATAAPPTPAAPTGPGPRDIWVKFAGRVEPTRVTLTCPEAPKSVGTVTQAAVRFSGVTAGARCKIQPEGSRSFGTHGVSAGGSYTCTLMADSGSTTCR